MNHLDVLVSLYRGYGLGDGVQMSSVLRHVAKYRPHWRVDYRAEEGKHQVGRGIVANHFAYGAPRPRPNTIYGAEVMICLFDTWANFHDRPNTRVSSCLREQFDIEWDPECGRYRIIVRSDSFDSARALLYGWGSNGDYRIDPEKVKYIAIHYEGDSSAARKNLTHGQVDDICSYVEFMGYTPLILDWRQTSPLPYRKVRSPTFWGRDAEMVCAVIRQCAGFIGIDSGPSKCAGSTDVPSLVVWTGHHPAPFYDPAPNVEHLVPMGYHGLEPVCNDRCVVEWFENNYRVRQYRSYPVGEIRRWVKELG